MTPAQFKTRFLAALPLIPPELDISDPVFNCFPTGPLQGTAISDTDRMILEEVGLPDQAPPFLSFGQPAGANLQAVRQPHSKPAVEFSRFLVLGHNNYGDHICLNAESGAVVYLDHDSHFLEVFINSSVEALAEALCLFCEARFQSKPDALRLLAQVDPPAAAEGSMWFVEFNALALR